MPIFYLNVLTTAAQTITETTVVKWDPIRHWKTLYKHMYFKENYVLSYNNS